jgi:ABC-type lipoprotein export system ATPase subunit
MLLQLTNISKGYGDPQKSNFRKVLEGLNLEIETGQKIAIAGPSGSGKTTLLNLIGTLDLPDSGGIYFKGKEITRYSKQELAHFRNQELGFVFQLHYLLPQCTVLENILLPVLPFKKNVSKEDRAWGEHLLRKVGLWELRNQRPSEISGGESQRAAVVRALINKPQLILADEPTGALDQQNAEKLTDILRDLSIEEHVTLIVVTHSGELASQMDKVYHLMDGKLTPDFTNGFHENV